MFSKLQDLVIVVMSVSASQSQVCDVPQQHGVISEALQTLLAQEDLFDIDILLRYRGIRTIRALACLEADDRAILLVRARELYECFEVLAVTGEPAGGGCRLRQRWAMRRRYDFHAFMRRVADRSLLIGNVNVLLCAVCSMW